MSGKYFCLEELVLVDDAGNIERTVGRLNTAG